VAGIWKYAGSVWVIKENRDEGKDWTIRKRRVPGSQFLRERRKRVSKA